jgi:hypothetical protein
MNIKGYCRLFSSTNGYKNKKTGRVCTTPGNGLPFKAGFEAGMTKSGFFPYPPE